MADTRKNMRKEILWPWRFRFIAFALGIALVAGLLLAIFWREIPDAHIGLITLLGLFVLGSWGLLAWLYFRLTNELLMPLLSLGRDLEANIHSGAPVPAAEYEGSLIRSFVDDLDIEARTPQAAGSNEQSENWLSELLQALDQGLIVANLDHEILLINTRAREMLGRHSALALGRDLSKLVDVKTIDHAISRQIGAESSGAERIFCRFLRDDQLMPARLSILHDQNDALMGYVLAFHDIANALYRTQELELGFDRLLQDARAFAGEVKLLRLGGVNSADIETRFEKALMQHKQDGQVHLGQAWPKGRMTLRNLFRVMSERAPNVTFATPPERVFLRCDGAAIIETTEHLLKDLQERGFSLSLDFEMLEEEVKIKISSGRKKIPIGDVENAMRLALTRLPTAPTGHEVLRAHGTEIWPHTEDNRSHLVFILKRTRPDLRLNAARPDYYDFEPRRLDDALEARRLRDLPIVVFDSETTGLDPKGGDQVVQLSAVRVRSGKLLSEEYFDELVNPSRSIPPASTKIHHIDDAMVANAPTFDAVVREFHEFCHEEVLLAHNAAFDMAFLRKGAKEAGVKFEQAVLDTVFMSAFLFDFSGRHTLDDLAARFGVEIEEAARHTALGDSLATASVFLKMLPMLEARGIETLGQMLEVNTQMRAIRKRQATYG